MKHICSSINKPTARLVASGSIHRSVVLLGFALAVATPLAHAQNYNRVCVMDDASWEVVCGRLATNEEINDYMDNQENRYQQNPTAPLGNRQPRQDVMPSPITRPVVVPTPMIVPAPPPPYVDLINGLRPSQPQPDTRMTEREANALVTRLYIEVLGRSPDAVALRNFSTEAIKGRSASDIRAELARSDEAKEAIRRLYREVLRREADPSGHANFYSKLLGGTSLAQIRAELAQSDEARRLR